MVFGFGDDGCGEAVFFPSAANVEDGIAIASPARLADFRKERRFMESPYQCELNRNV
jgi:hypothetical protein